MTASVRDLDHRGRIGTSLTDAGLARFNTKREASAFAKSHGWRTGDVFRVANRFWVYWVVGQCTGVDTIRYLAKDGSFIDSDFPGYW